MDKTKNRFTFKIILSYLALGALAIVVGYFLYVEFEFLLNSNSTKTEDEKLIETGTLINQVYETDGFSRLALLTEDEADFDVYKEKANALLQKIEDIKALSTFPYQKAQLDSVKMLLIEKNQNIEQLRILKLTNNKDSSLDDIAKEFNKLETSMGKLTVESFVRYPQKLTRYDRRVWENYVDYLNKSAQDSATVKTQVVDSMLTATRFILREAKRENSKARAELLDKENELIKNDLTISAQLRQIIAAFDAEVKRNTRLEFLQRRESVDRTSTILKIAGILGFVMILLFTYIILNDFFKAEKFKASLKQAKDFSDDLLKSREQLISTVSHDLKTPLNTIVGYSDLMESTLLSDKQKYYVKQITNSSHYVTKLVDDLLDFSKLEAGKLTIENVPFSLESIIIQTAEASKDIYQKEGVKLVVSISEAIKKQVFSSDPLRIRQIINNLVGNAFKFTSAGSVTITAEVLENSGDKNLVCIKVSDTGIGISKEKQELVFKEFQQASEQTANSFGGYGLGLAISRKLTALLDGNLTMESDLGKGSTFILTLPLKTSAHSLKSENETLTKATKPMTVVVIDDDISMTKLLAEVFEQLNITSYTYNDFNNFESDKAIAYDMVLTDIEMPTVNGFKVLENLKRHHKANYHGQPIVAMTGSKEYSLNSFKEQGFSGLLQKPFPKEKLFSILYQLFPDKMGSPAKTVEDGPTHSNNSTLYNLSMLKSFLSTEEALEDILLAFYDEVYFDLERLKTAIDSEDYKSINDIAHKMLTLNRQLEAVNVIPILDRLEYVTAENLEADNLTTIYKNLKQQIDVLITALKER